MDPDYATRYVEYEKSHWWFRARRRILKTLLDQGVDWDRVSSLLEIGAGSGANLAELYPDGVTLTGIEPDGDLAERARGRGIATIHVGVLEDSPKLLAGQVFDVVTLFDVLEHVEDDRAALRILPGLIRPEGWLVLSVPAYQWLWSKHDVVNHHYRRYSREALVDRVREAGFRVFTATYFNTLLFAPIAAIRLLGRLLVGAGGKKATSDFQLPSAGLNELLCRVFAAERALVTRLALPFGVSLFVLARRAPVSASASIFNPIPVLP